MFDLPPYIIGYGPCEGLLSLDTLEPGLSRIARRWLRSLGADYYYAPILRDVVFPAELEKKLVAVLDRVC